jgi:hypothetical protein
MPVIDPASQILFRELVAKVERLIGKSTGENGSGVYWNTTHWSHWSMVKTTLELTLHAEPLLAYHYKLPITDKTVKIFYTGAAIYLTPYDFI